MYLNHPFISKFTLLPTMWWLNSRQMLRRQKIINGKKSFFPWNMLRPNMIKIATRTISHMKFSFYDGPNGGAFSKSFSVYYLQCITSYICIYMHVLGRLTEIICNCWVSNLICGIHCKHITFLIAISFLKLFTTARQRQNTFL